VFSRRSEEELPGALAVVTDVDDPVAFEVARELASRGATVVCTAADSQRGGDAVASLRHCVPEATVRFLPLDFADGDAVDGFIRLLPAVVGKSSLKHVTVEYLVFAGAWRRPPCGASKMSPVGFAEWQMAVCHDGPAALARALEPCVRFAHRRRGGRVVFRCGPAHIGAADHHANALPADAYGAAAFRTARLVADLAAGGINSFAAHPGVLGTGPSLLVAKTPQESAQTLLHCCVGPLSSRTREQTVPDGSSWVVRGGFYADARLANTVRDPNAFHQAA